MKKPDILDELQKHKKATEQPAAASDYYLPVDPAPPGCLELPGFIVPIHSKDDPAWLTLYGAVTHVWSERGNWETAELAYEAISKFCR
jgi:hypothetical protein